MILSKFEDILKTPGLNLKQFFRTAAEDLFPEAQFTPDVLKCSASNGNRFIKQFLNNPHGNLRIFYFQLLRLCYSTNLVHTLGFFNRIKKVVFNPDFIILFSFDTEEQSSLFNNLQFKKLFAQFLDYLDHEEDPNIQNSINDYPIIDIVLIHILRSLLVTRNINPDFSCKIETDTVFRELSEIFKLKLSVFVDYWVFEDSDFIVYAENDWELYISYKEKIEVIDQVRRRKYINGLLLNKSTQITQPSKENIPKNKMLNKEKSTNIASLTITNLTSPKNKITNKMFLTNINFSSSTTNKFIQKQSAKSNNFNLKGYANEIKKSNPQNIKNQNYEDMNRTMRKGNAGSQSLAYFGFRNKQNYPTTRNISFDPRKQHRSRSVYKVENTFKSKNKHLKI